MFAPASHLDGQYTVVGKVVAARTSSTRSSAATAPTATVSDPDWMATVRVKADG